MGNTMKPIRTAIFGTGFMGRGHLEAVRRVEFVEAAGSMFPCLPPTDLFRSMKRAIEGNAC